MLICPEKWRSRQARAAPAGRSESGSATCWSRRRRYRRSSSGSAWRSRSAAGASSAACSSTAASSPRSRSAQALARQLQPAVHQPQALQLNRAVVVRLPEDAGAPLPRARARGSRRAHAGRHGRPDRPVRLRRNHAHPRSATSQLAVVTEAELLQAVDRVYRRTEEITGLAKELERGTRRTPIDFGALGAGAGRRRCAGGQAAAVAVRGRDCRSRASDIHIEPQENTLQIRFRIDGVLQLQTEADMRDRAGRGAAPEADVGPRHLREAPAAGRPLQRQGARAARSTCGSRPCRRSTASRW